MKKKDLHHLGIPKFIGTGSHEHRGKGYRFLVMDRYGTDLNKLFEQNGRKFPQETVYKIALQIVRDSNNLIPRNLKKVYRLSTLQKRRGKGEAKCGNLQRERSL